MAPGWSAYHASKSAANAWCETANSEFAPLGVRVQIAYLPLVHTAMSDATSGIDNYLLTTQLMLPTFSCDSPYERGSVTNLGGLSCLLR